MAERFDAVILGGGPGGYAAALYGAASGMRIALIEQSRVGGTCLHRGCIPAKELLQTAEIYRTVGNSTEFGVETSKPTLNLVQSQSRKTAVIEKLTKGLEGLLKGRKVTVIPGTGTVVDVEGRHVAISDGSEVIGGALILATGSAPRSLPGLEFDGERILSSDHVLELSEIPKRSAIIGGGAIGCEFASFLADVGSDVTILEALPQVLTGVDKQVADVVVKSFAKRGIKVQAGIKVTGIDEKGDELIVRYEQDEKPHKVTVDKIVLSVGRSPRTQDIGLEEADILNEKGFVEVDSFMRTKVPGVYAVGDVVNTPALAHVGFAEAIVAIKTILGEVVAPIDYGKVPWGIYCHPEVSFCGLTEEKAKEAGYDVQTSVHKFVGNGRALIIGEPDGLVKIVSERGGPILGVHIVGPWATELLAEGYLAVNWEATPAEVGALIHPHPTLSELFGESALALTGRALHG